MKDSIIVEHLDLIDDSTSIPAEVPNFGGHYAIGDAAIMVLKEIVRPFEPIRILGIKLDPMCGYWVEDTSFATCDCKGEHPNKGHFQIEKGK